jgi:hypothetical protein
MTPTQKLLAALFLSASLGHAVAGLFSDSVPAWKMFAQVQRYDYDLRDRSGAELVLRDYVVDRAYLMSGVLAVPWIAEWLVRRHPEMAPIRGHLRHWQDDGRIREADFAFGFDAKGQPGVLSMNQWVHD